MPKKDILKFNKTLLDKPINLTRKRIVRNNKLALEPLPEPLIPTQYVAPENKIDAIDSRPVPLPRFKSKRPVPLPRRRKLYQKIKNLIAEITPYYSQKNIKKFKKDLKFINRAEITEKKKALKGNVANYSLSIVNEFDPSMQLTRTRDKIEEKLISLIKEKRKGLKFGESLKIRMQKETVDGIIYSEPYFNSKQKQ